MRAVVKLLGVVSVMCVLSVAQADKTPPPKPKAKPVPAAAKPAVGSADLGSAGDADLGSADDAEAQLPAHILGPKLVDLGGGNEIDLPANTILFERDVAREMLKKGGDSGENVEAIVVRPGADWSVVIQYDDAGYVSDSDADKLDADDLFASFKSGNEEQNARRKEMGISPLVLDGWSEKPQYDILTHQLNWGLKAHADTGPIINFFTRVLGRNGFMSVNLIDSPDRIEASKRDAADVIGATRFKQGMRYQDHASGDKDSGIGLRGLVLGGTGVAIAAKTGLLLKLLLILKKGIIVIFAAVGGFFRWLFGKKKKPAEVVVAETPPTPPQDPPPPAV
jgi:uncharacterized membrane-anchored protein